MRLLHRYILKHKRVMHACVFSSSAAPTAAAAPEAAGEALRFRLLEQAMLHVPVLGWSEDALAKAATDLGMPPLSFRIVNRGPVELVEHFLRKKMAHVRSVMQTNKEEEKGGNKGQSERSLGSEYILERAIEAHLDYIHPHLSTWPSALALLAEPQQVPHTLTIMQDVLDDLCEFADIQTSRIDWYVERGLLLSLLGSTELFMLTDNSQDLTDTKLFLKRAFDLRRSATPTFLVVSSLFGNKK